MNFILILTPMKKFPLLFIGALLLSALPGFGQAVPPPAPVGKTEEKVDYADIANVRAAVDQAKLLAASNNAADAEELLSKLNEALPDTAEWKMETAQRLMQTAEQLARDGQPDKVGALAARALQQLTGAEAIALDPEIRASAKALAGFIYERYLANPTAAAASYQAAVNLAPDKATQAKEAVERLKKLSDNAKEKAANAGK